MSYRTLVAVLATLIISACSGIPKRSSDQEELARNLQYAGEPVSSISARSPSYARSTIAG